jgi:hypothetical protein
MTPRLPARVVAAIAAAAAAGLGAGAPLRLGPTPDHEPPVPLALRRAQRAGRARVTHRWRDVKAAVPRLPDRPTLRRARAEARRTGAPVAVAGVRVHP